MENILIKIDLNRIEENYKKISKYVQPFKVIPVLKADAYGHGIEQVSKIFNENDTICVSSIDEGIKVRKNSNAKIICLTSPKKEDIKYIKKYQIMPTIFLKEHIEVLKDYKTDCLLNFEINTGMGRSGISLAETKEFIQNIRNKGYSINSIYTHIYDSHSLEKIFMQIENLKLLSEKSPIHINGSSLLRNKDVLNICDIRIGRALFGLTGTDINETIGLKPALKLVTTIDDIFFRDEGEGIGYSTSNRTILKRKTKVGLVNVGYSLGIPVNDRVYIQGMCIPIIGGINMTNFCIDLTDVPNAYVGQEITLIDDNYLSENSTINIANRNRLNVNQVVCNIDKCIRKVYLNEK